MNDVLQERERCAKLIENLMRRNTTSLLWQEKLREVLKKIRNPKSTGTSGGPLTEQLDLPFDN